MKSREHPKRKSAETDAREGGNAAARIGPHARARIGRQLRAMYDEVVEQGVPDRFADLLKQLDSRKNSKD